MGNEIETQASSIALDILAKFGLALSKTKDSLFLDLKERLPQEDIKNPNDIFNYFDELFEFLGYSAEGLIPDGIKATTSKSFELAENIDNLIKKIGPASEYLKALNWDDVKGDPDEEEDLDAPEVILEMGESIIKLVSNLIDLVKLFKEDFEANYDANKEAWNKLIHESNLEEDLPKRLFDHILNTFLKNLFEVFKGDIAALIEKVKNAIENTQIDESIFKEITLIFEAFDAIIEDESANIEAQLTRIVQLLIKELKTVIKAVEQTAFTELKTALNNLKKFIDALNYFKQAEAILIFFKLSTEERITVFKTQIETVPSSIDDVLNLTTVINVIHWNRVEKLFTNPIDYFNEHYPLESFDQASELLDAISILAKAFGFDIPDTSSMKALLLDLLKKIGEEIKTVVDENIVKIFDGIDKIIRSFLSYLEAIVLELKNNIENHVGTLLNNIVNDVKEVYQHILDNTHQINSDVKELLEDLPKPQLIGEAEMVKDIFEEVLLPVIEEKAKEFEAFKDLTITDWKALLSNISTQYYENLQSLKTDINEFANNNWLENKYESISDAIKEEFNRQTKNIPNSYEQLFDRFNNPDSLHPKELFSDFDPYAFIKITSTELKKGFGVFNPETYFLNFINISVNAFNTIIVATDDTAKGFQNQLPNKNEVDKLKKNFEAFLNKVLVDAWKKIKEKLIDTYISPFSKAFETIIQKKGIDLLREIINIVKTIKLPNETETLWDKIKGEIPGDVQTLADALFPIIEDAMQSNVKDWKSGIKLGLKVTKALYSTYNDDENFKEVINKIIPIGNMDWLMSSPSITLTTAEQNEDEGHSNGNTENSNTNKSSGIDFYLPDFEFDVDNLFLCMTLFQGEKDGAKGLIKLCIFVGKREIELKDDKKEDKKEEVYGLYIIPTLEGEWDVTFEAGSNHFFNLLLKAYINSTGQKDEEDPDNTKLIEALKTGTLGLFLSHKKAVWLDALDKLSASAELTFNRKEGSEALEILKSKYLDFTIDKYPQKVSLGYKDKAFFWNYTGAVENGQLILKVRNINSFFEELLKEDITANFDLKLIWDSKEGLKFDGNAGLKTSFNLEKKIADIFTLHKLGFEIGKAPKLGSNLQLFINSDFTIDFGSISFAVADLGLGFNINYLKPNGSLGDFNMKPTFSFPSGMGVTIDASAIKGSGVISYNAEKEEFIGALSLDILEKIELRALAVLNLKMPDGSKGFSFVGILSVYFKPGIPIGMGFSLTAVGGALGLNRNISEQAMQQGVRSGEVGTVFFVEDLDKNKDVILNNIGTYFPMQQQQFFFGILARISYAEFLDVDLGLLITAPQPVALIIVGGIHIVLPDKKAPLIELHAYFVGYINFTDGYLTFDASLVNSQIVGIDIYGDIALRIGWGKKKGFLFSAGGFHPLYKPEEGLNIGDMKRMGMKLDYSLLKLTMESYFAITSNTVQFGARVDIFIGWSSAKITGYFYFDALFQFKPFWFIIEIGTGVKVVVLGITLMSVDLAFMLSGPAKWNAAGKAKFKILGIGTSVKFNKTWGKDQVQTHISYISLYDILSEEYHKVENWKVISSGQQDDDVEILDLEEHKQEIIIQPFDNIHYEQSKIPFNTLIQRFGEGVSPGDFSKIEIKKITIGKDLVIKEDEYTSTQYEFAPSLFFNLSEEEKLSSPSYEGMESGLIIEKNIKETEVGTSTFRDVNYKTSHDEISFTKIRNRNGTYQNTGYQIKEKDENDNVITKKINYTAAEGTTNVEALHSNEKISNIAIPISRRTSKGFRHYVRSTHEKQRSINRRKFEAFNQERKRESYVVAGLDRSNKINYKRTRPTDRNIETIIRVNSYQEAVKLKEEMIKDNPRLKRGLNIKNNMR